MNFLVGEIYIYQIPFVDNPKKSKPRPVLIVGEQNRHGDVMVLAGSSKLMSWDQEETIFSVEPHQLEDCKLTQKTIFPISKQLLVSTSHLKIKLGKLKLEDCQKVLKFLSERLTKTYFNVAHKVDPQKVTKNSPIPYAGRVFDEQEVVAGVSSMLDFWLTLGKEGEAMEKELADVLGVRKSLLVNSGSSANLVSFAALTSHKLPADKRILYGDEVITCAAGFPTTVTPIVQNGAVPVFVDCDLLTGNIDVSKLEEAYVKGKTKAVMVAHALGNPFNLRAILDFCQRYNLWLVEDNCDALGCEYLLDDVNLSFNPQHHKVSLSRPTGSFGHLSTQSFYPPHHITMGEGGSVNIVSDMMLKICAESFRDWGRDCWCPSGVDNTCNKRYAWQLGELPEGYDHKYVYSHLGYNLKPLDVQAAIGREQLKKLPMFIEARKRNWQTLRQGLANLEEFFEFTLPTHAKAWTPNGFTWDDSGCKTECSWFAFLMQVKKSAPFTSRDLARYLEDKKIGNRMFFGGNLTKQPAFVQLKKDRANSFRIVGELKNADNLMNSGLFLGTYPGLNNGMITTMIEVIQGFVEKH